MQELKHHFSTHQEENNEDEEEYPDEDPLMEKALGNALRVITFKPERVQKNDFLQLLSDRKEDVVEYVENETKGTNACEMAHELCHSICQV